MKKILLLSAAVIFGAGSAFAHCGACGSDAAHKSTEAKSSCTMNAKASSCSGATATAAKSDCSGKSSCSMTATASAAKDCGSSCGGKEKAKAAPSVASSPPSCCGSKAPAVAQKG